MPENKIINYDEPEQGYLSRLPRSIKQTIWLSIISVLIISLFDLIGWITGIEWMKSLSPNWTPMKIISALCFILIALSLAVIYTGKPAAVKKIFPVSVGIFLILISLLSVFCAQFLAKTGHETLLTQVPFFDLFLSAGNRLPQLSAFILFSIGIVVILLSGNLPTATNIAHTIFIPATIAGYIIPLSYLLSATSPDEFFNDPVALNSGLCFWTVSIAVYLIRSDSWIMKVFTSDTTGGLMARRLLPWLLLLPIFMGWFHIYGVGSEFFTSEAGELIEEIVYTVCFVVLVWFSARSVIEIDRKRRLADEALKRSNEELEERVRERTIELINLNKVLDEEIKVRSKAEELVAAERQKFNGLLELMPAYIVLLTPDYHVAYSNRYFNQRFGESGGKRCFEFLFNRTTPCELCETYKVLGDNKPHTWEWTGPDGRIYSVYDFPYIDTDGSTLIMEMGIDVTGLKTAEANLVTLNAQLEQRIRERTSNLLLANDRLDILSETSSRLLASENPQELVNSLCSRVMKFLDCHVFFNFLVDDSKGKLHLNAYSGVPDETAQKIEWLDRGVAICGCVARDGTKIIAENISSTDDVRTELVKSFGVQAYACHPLLSHDKVIGTLSFGTKTRARFTDEDISLMKTVADQVAVAITRVRDEDQIRKSEERYRKLLNLSPSACLVNRNDSIELVNPAAMELLGINSVEKVLGTSLLKFFHPDFHSQIRERLDRVENGENVPLQEEKIIRSDGMIRDIEVVSVAMVDKEGPVFQVIMNDITDRKLAEKELYDTKNYLQNLIDNANAPIIVWDQENRIQLFNHAFEHLTGYSAPEVEGRKLDLLFPEGSLKESMQKIKRALTENWKTIEIPILTKDKNTRIVLWNSAKIHDKNRKSFSTIAQGNDITERIEAEKAFKESREKLEIALENGKIGTWEWDLKTDEFIPDERMERILGRNSESFENSYNAFEKSIHEEDVTHVRDAIRHALDDNIPFETIFRVKHKNDKVNYVSTKALVEKDFDGNPVKMSGVCFDITDMKMGAEKALFTLNEELLRSNKELEQFAYVASHDLQEPLRMVSSFTQLLAQRYKGQLDSNAQEFIQYAVEGAMRMQVLINDLLNYSRIQTRGTRFADVNINSVLKQVINTLSLKIHEKKARITIEEVPVVFADEGQMTQVFQNLVGNALKFSKNAPKINISAKAEKDHYLFSVKDNGIGIEPQYFDRIFQIFQRLHPKDEWGGGTGIGLAICKRIIERHGGKIWVESKPGKGSVFYFTIKK